MALAVVPERDLRVAIGDGVATVGAESLDLSGNVAGVGDGVVQPPWWEKTRDFPNMVADQQDGKGYEGTDEYLPHDADAYDVQASAPPVKLENNGKVQVQIQTWKADEKNFSVSVRQPANLVLRLFTYPAWRAEVNGQVVETDNQDNTGQMLIPASIGENRVRVTLVRTHDQILGDIVSSVTATLILALLWWRRKLRVQAS